MATGGVTFHNSPAFLSDVWFSGSTAEDAVNVIGAPVNFVRVQITNALSDGFDGDFVSGTVSNSIFREIGGDALDFSGSQVHISDSLIEAIGDKGISAGEKTVLTARSLVIRNVGMGVASKDLSTVTLVDVSIAGATQAGLAAFQKKPGFGPGRIVATMVDISDTAVETLAQTRSEITIDGREVATSDLDVEALYDTGLQSN